MKYEKEILIAKLRKMDLTTLADKLEDGCNCRGNVVIMSGSSLVDKANAITLEKRYSEIITWSPCYGGVVIYAALNGLNNADLDDLEALERDLTYIERDYPLLNEDEYYSLQFDMVNETLDEWYSDMTREEKTAAGDYLYSCSFYSDFIDYSESDLLEYVKREAREA